MARFKVALWQDGGEVKMQVLEMDNELRGTGDIFRFTGGMIVDSVSHPALAGEVVHLRGTWTSQDDIIASNIGDSAYYARVRDALIAAGGEVVGRPGEVGEQTTQPECQPVPTPPIADVKVTVEDKRSPPDIRTYRLDVMLDDRRPTFSVELKLTPNQYGALVRYVAGLI